MTSTPSISRAPSSREIASPKKVNSESTSKRDPEWLVRFPAQRPKSPKKRYYDSSEDDESDTPIALKIKSLNPEITDTNHNEKDIYDAVKRQRIPDSNRKTRPKEKRPLIPVSDEDENPMKRKRGSSGGKESKSDKSSIMGGIASNVSFAAGKKCKLIFYLPQHFSLAPLVLLIRR